jgi:hypothetical protein
MGRGEQRAGPEFESRLRLAPREHATSNAPNRGLYISLRNAYGGIGETLLEIQS